MLFRSMTKTSPHEEDIDMLFHTCRAIDHLQRETYRQAQLLNALEKELIHLRDEDKDTVPSFLNDYGKAEAG